MVHILVKCTQSEVTIASLNEPDMRRRRIKYYAEAFKLCRGNNLLKLQFAGNILCNISNTRDSVSSGYPNTEKRLENTTPSGVFLTRFEVSE